MAICGFSQVCLCHVIGLLKWQQLKLTNAVQSFASKRNVMFIIHNSKFDFCFNKNLSNINNSVTAKFENKKFRFSKLWHFKMGFLKYDIKKQISKSSKITSNVTFWILKPQIILKTLCFCIQMQLSSRTLKNRVLKIWISNADNEITKFYEAKFWKKGFGNSEFW